MFLHWFQGLKGKICSESPRPALRVSIAQLGDPILRQPAQPITDPTALWVQALADQMIAHIGTCKAVGIAAPQVSQPYCLMVIASHPSDRYPHAPDMEPLVLINPQIVDQSTERVKDWEGCLSVPQLRGLVNRWQWVEVSYLDRQGNPQQQRFEDFVARIFQHEYDHLIGKVFLDYIEGVDDLMAEQEWRLRVCAQTA
jgi:peptide deformylase